MMKRFAYLAFLLPPLAAFEQRKFYPDDPLDKEPAPLSAEKVNSRKLSDYYDLFYNQFGHPGEPQPKKGRPPIRAKGVNTLGEPMDGAWYTKRHYYHRMSIEELQRGPGNTTAPTAGKWTVIGAKSEGITAGFTILDAQKRRYFVKFDPISNPEMATSADSITSRFFYALGYHVPQNYLVTFATNQLELGENVEVMDKQGRKRMMTQRDIFEILSKAPSLADGRYRATASLAIEGRPVGPPRYHGSRKDDPDDVVPHEHRRELRGLHVFAAWLDHDDSRAINNYDALVTENGRSFLKHYLLDFGSTLGSGSQRANSPRSGAYYFGWKTSAEQLFTLGLNPPYWARAKYHYYPSVGRFEGKVFNPDRWTPEYFNPAFLNRLPDDEFWAAKQVMAFTDDEIRATVATGQISDHEAEEYLVRCLIQRRDTIGRVYFAKVLPFDRFRLEGGKLLWDDLSHGVNDAKVAWHSFDNKTGARSPAPGPPAGAGEYGVAEISAPSRPNQTILAYFRQGKLVGVDRNW